MTTPSVFLVFSSQLAAGVSAANAGTTPNDATGTVIGIGQAAQSIGTVATIATDSAAVSYVPIAGFALGAAGAANNTANILKSLSTGSGTVSRSDIAGLISNIAGTVGGGAGTIALLIPAAAAGAAPVIVF